MTRRATTLFPEELAWIEANRALPRAVLHRRFCFMFDRQEVSLAALVSLCKRHGWLTGRDGRWRKGDPPRNQQQLAKLIEASRATRFKKGQRPNNTKPDGHERIDRNGYVMIRVSEPNPWTGAESRMIHKHRWLWERANGPVPEGHRLKCLDGDRTNTDPSNWEAVPVALAPRLNGRFGRGYDAAPAELKPTIMAIAKLQHRARQARSARSKA